MSTRKTSPVPTVHQVASAITSVPHKPFPETTSPLAKERDVLIGEYLAAKAKIIASAVLADDGRKVVPPEVVRSMTAREHVGMYLRTYGANGLRAFLAALPRGQRRAFEKDHAGFTALLRKHCPEGNA